MNDNITYWRIVVDPKLAIKKQRYRAEVWYDDERPQANRQVSIMKYDYITKTYSSEIHSTFDNGPIEHDWPHRWFPSCGYVGYGRGKTMWFRRRKSAIKSIRKEYDKGNQTDNYIVDSEGTSRP